MTELTKEERRNGWTEESLAQYRQEREVAAAERIDPHSEARRVRPSRQNNCYSPLKWRR